MRPVFSHPEDLLRGDSEIAVRHLLKAFVVDARTARQELALRLFEEYFLAQRKDVQEWYNKELQAIEKNEFRKAKLMAAGKTVLGVGGALAMGLANKNAQSAAKGMAQKAAMSGEADWRKATVRIRWDF